MMKSIEEIEKYKKIIKLKIEGKNNK